MTYEYVYRYGRYSNEFKLGADAMTISWMATANDCKKSKILAHIISLHTQRERGEGCAEVVEEKGGGVEESGEGLRSGGAEGGGGEEGEMRGDEEKYVLLFCRLKCRGYVNMGE